eukprot:53499-Prorocentrum_minimum.AAC.1
MPIQGHRRAPRAPREPLAATAAARVRVAVLSVPARAVPFEGSLLARSLLARLPGVPDARLPG